MGMDTVEIVIAIEKAFDIVIPDEDAANLLTVGMVTDYVSSAIKSQHPKDSRPLNDDEILVAVIKITAEVLGVDPTAISRDSKFADDLGAQ